LKNLNPTTIQNYQKLKNSLDDKKIRLVCVQYPMRNIIPLTEIFVGQEVLFVDNESIFKDAVKKDGYDKYFEDCFAGDFGHCTPEGNRLLAQNIANVILGQVFKKKINKNGLSQKKWTQRKVGVIASLIRRCPMEVVKKKRFDKGIRFQQ